MNDTLPPQVEAPHESRLKATWRAHWRLWLAAVLVLAIIAGVVAWAVLRAPANAPAAKGRGGFDPNARPLPVVAAPARKGNIDVHIDALGTVTPRNMVVVHSRVDGQLLGVGFREGQEGKKGEMLAQIDPRPFEVQLTQALGQMARDQAQLKNAQLDLERYRTLLAQDSISKQQVDTQEALVRQFQGTVATDQGAIDNAKLQLTYSRVTAPISGRVGLRQVDPGNMVHASATNGLVVLTQTHPIYVVFAVPSAHLAQIYPHWSRGDALTVQALDRDGKVLASGKLAAVDNQIDTSTGTIRIKAQFDNSNDALFPDQFVTARLKMDTLSGATLVPAASVQRGAPGTFVYVVNADNTVSLRKLSLGPASGELVSVQDGVQPGEKVVIDGLDKLRDGARVALIADNIRGATAPRAPPPPPAQHPHRRRTAAASAPVTPRPKRMTS